MNDKEIIDKLNAEIIELKRQLTIQRDNNHDRNLELDALHYVWCDGGCSSGVHRYEHREPLTAEIVALAERNTARLRRWLLNNKYKKGGDWEAEREKLINLRDKYYSEEILKLENELIKVKGRLKFLESWQVSDKGLGIMRDLYERKLDEHPDSPLADALGDALRDIDQLIQDRDWERTQRQELELRLKEK